MMQPERRRQTRFHQPHIQVSLEAQGESHTGELVNISRQGAFVQVFPPSRPDAVFTLHLPGGTEISKKCKVLRAETERGGWCALKFNEPMPELVLDTLLIPAHSQHELILRCAKEGDLGPWNDWRRRYPWVPINLREADLAGQFLAGADLHAAHLAGADLQGADLSKADLRQADLQGAQLAGANLRQAVLAGATLRQADLRKAVLESADLRGADLEGADLEGADLDKAILPDSPEADARPAAAAPEGAGGRGEMPAAAARLLKLEALVATIGLLLSLGAAVAAFLMRGPEHEPLRFILLVSAALIASTLFCLLLVCAVRRKEGARVLRHS
ncbi:MAG: pentapeptide repeat-containing protein [Planctomycetota bacterium]|nr:pentapeptide repeat-containing protein [Planctomycetota bacterium]